MCMYEMAGTAGWGSDRWLDNQKLLRELLRLKVLIKW